MTVRRPLELMRDGTLVLPEGTQIDLRTPDSEVWITVKADRDVDAERVVADLLDVLGCSEGT